MPAPQNTPSSKRCTALLVIDVQTALCAGTWAAHRVDEVLDRINIASSHARAAGAPVVLIQHEDDSLLLHGSPGWSLDERLKVADGDLRLRKTATDSFHKTDLHERLQALGVTDLVICGLQSDFCVDTTTRRGLALGYPIQLLEDGHSTVGNSVLEAEQISAHHQLTLCNIESFGVRARSVRAADAVFERSATP
ncbi:cysteine hydrolase family protein [Burkholderiaceae bacterium UC74_6]